MDRYFTLNEAERLLPEIRLAMREALALAAAHEGAEAKLQDALRRISMLGGSMVNRAGILELREHRNQTADAVNEAIGRIHSHGCQIKDLRSGLVDFPTLYRGNEVLMCWRFGEDAIQFWHGLEEGFRGRKPIDQDFLDHHHGDRPN